MKRKRSTQTQQVIDILREQGFQDAIVQTTTKVIWSISRAISFVSLCAVIFLFSSSQDKTEESELLLGENEICFNEKLVSITKNGENYYIGTESSGRIYVYSPEENRVIDTLNIDCGRIYQVKQINETDSFYVGTQNMGLKKTRKVGKSLKIDTSYVIRGKGNRFSCYDVFMDEDTVYAMTSHGIFVVEESDTLKRIFPNPDKNGVPDPLVANNMVKADGYLFAATDTGLVTIKNKKVDKIVVREKIKNVACHDNFVYALGGSLYKIDPANLNIDIVKLKAPAKYYFHADGIHHFLSESYMVLAHDSVLHKPEQHKQVTTRRKLSIAGHNVIADGKEYSLLVTESALWQVGHHYPSVFGNLKKEGGVKLACTDGKSAYFLVGKKLYKLGANNVAKEMLELKENGEIKLMECSLDSIYYVNSDNEVLRQGIETPWYKFWLDEPDSIGNSKKEITAMCIYSNPGVVLGVRDGLIRMNKPNMVNTIVLRTHEPEGIDSIPYIRRFYVKDSIYVPTMNEGLFKGKGDTLDIVKETEKLQFIRDVARQDCFLYLLTNRYLFLGKDSTDNNRYLFLGNDSTDNKNHGSRLLVSRDMIYIPGEVRGVRAIRVSKDNTIQSDSILFPDISFRAESSCVLNNTVYLGGASGVIALNSTNGDANNVKFVDRTPFSVILLLFSLSLLAIIFCFVLWLRERTITIHWKNFHKESLESKIGRLKESKVYNLLDSSYQSKIDNLENDVNKLHVVGRKEKKKNSKEISSRLDELTIGITLLLKDFLSFLKEKYVKLACDNESLLFDKKHKDGNYDFKLLASLISEYEKQIRIEEDIAWYKLILGEKLNMITTMEYKPIPDELSQIEDIRCILNKENYDSQNKLSELELKLSEGKHDILQKIECHVEERMEKLKKIRNNDNYCDVDNEILTHIQFFYKQIKDKIPSKSEIEIKDLFGLIKDTTLNDGKLEMVTQLMNIRDIVKDEKLNKKDKTDLETTIKKFYIPTLAFHIDLDVYEHLLESTINDKGNPPKGIKGNFDSIQPSFFILAIAMAKSIMPDKCKYYFEDKKDSTTISRGKGFANRWVNCSYIKNHEKRTEEPNSPNDKSVATYYLKKIAVNARQKQ